jgi:L-alanine-DL-glutamate epimerase-like enolase superfamily enzyme
VHVLSTETVGLTHVRVPLNEPFVISSGAVTHKDAILIEFLAEGLVGYGEASPMGGSFDSRHTPESSWQSLTDHVLPRLAGRDALNPLDPALLGDLDDPYVAAAFDAALWDLVAKAQGLPLWARLGGDGEKPVESGLAVGITNTIDELLNLIAGYLAQGA